MSSNYLSKMKYFILSLIPFNLFCQNFRPYEQKLVSLYDSVKHYSYFGVGNNYDKQQYYLKKFENGLLNLTSKIPRSISHSFDSLKTRGIQIVTSKDLLVRGYSWSTFSGGTASDDNRLIQYLTKDTVCAQLTSVNYESNWSYWFSDMEQLKIDGKTVYFFRAHSMASSKDALEGYLAYTFEDHKLKEYRVFQYENNVHSHEYFFEYNFFSVVDRKERPIKLLKLNKKKLTIPQTDTENKVVRGKITKKFDNGFYQIDEAYTF